MKRKLLQITFSVIALLLCATALGMAIELPARAEEQYGIFDYGDGRTATNEEISASELFEMALGSAPTGVEREYLDKLSDIRLSYNAAIPTQNISTTYHRENGSLDITVTPYLYVAKNGATVEWVPRSATIDQRTLPLDAAYSCHFDGLSHLSTGDFQVEVVFYSVITLQNDALTLLANDAYKSGCATLKVLDDYAEEYRAWEAAQNRYLAYEAFLEASARFAAYEEALLAYNAEYAVYEQYCRDYEQYRATLRIYEDWRQYYAYQKFLEEGVERYRVYLEYRLQVDKVIAKLEVMERLFVGDSHGWQMYASLMGGTVTQVVNRKDELIAAGCNAKDINAAGAATEELRVLMKGYADLRKVEYASEHDRLTALYDYYAQNYSGIRDGYKKLYGALISLYDNSLVVSALDMEGRLDHFQQFVGQLYYTTTVLDDNVKTSDSWTISKKKLTDVVEECHRVADTNTAAPADVRMPATAVEAVEKVDPIDEPLQPDPIVKPTPPKEVSEPKKPTEVADPSLSPIPPYAEDPGAAPQAPETDPILLRLAEAVRGNTLTEHTVAVGETSISLTATCSRPVSIDNKKVVTFYDSDRKTVLYQTTLEYGSPVTYLGPDVQSKQDERYYYSFYRWELADHTPAEMVAYTDLSLYAKYWQRDRFYTVTWILDGISYAEQYVWGAVPIAPFSSEKNESEGYTYRFSGWSSDAFEADGIHPVSGDVTYVAEFEPIPKQFTVKWVFPFEDGKDVGYTECYNYLDYPRFSGSTEYADTSYRYTFKGWQESLQTVKTDVTYHAKLERTPLAVADDGQVLEVIHTDDALRVTCTVDRVDLREAALSAHAAGKRLVLVWEDFSVTLSAASLEQLINSNCRKIGYLPVLDASGEGAYRLTYYNSLNHSVMPTFEVCLQSNGTQGGKRLSLYCLQDGEWLPVGSEGVNQTGNLTYRIVEAYRITVGSAANCDLSTLGAYADAGSRVDLRLSCKFGYEVSGATVRTENGVEILVTDLCFIMPNQAVSIDLEVTRIVYRVSFVVDGTIVSECEYFLGDRIEVPLPPQKPSDGIYDYTFAGWSKDLTVAHGDERTIVVEARFISTEIPKKDPYQSLHNNNLLLTVILPAFGGVVLLTVGLVVLLKQLKKRKINALAVQDAEATELSTHDADVAQEEQP